MGLWQSIKRVFSLVSGKTGEDKTFSSQRTFVTEQDAKSAFEDVVKRLFNVNAWSDMEGINSTFTLFSSKGDKVDQKIVEVGDFIKIDLPGIETENWVEVISKSCNIDRAEFTVRPSKKPNHPTGEVEHFFSQDAKSTFRVTRQGAVLYAYEIGRDEVVNNQGKEAGDRKALNTVIATGGWAGFQKIQWEKLTSFLVGNQ